MKMTVGKISDTCGYQGEKRPFVAFNESYGIMVLRHEIIQIQQQHGWQGDDDLLSADSKDEGR